MKLEGVFLYYDKENKNGRIYTKEVAEDIVKQFRERDEGTVLGELGHPEPLEITIANVSHVTKDLWIDEEEQCIKGIVEVLDTPAGKNFKKIIREVYAKTEKGSSINFSCVSRGTGTINENKEVEDYTLSSFDIIPSAESAFPNPLTISDL